MAAPASPAVGPVEEQLERAIRHNPTFLLVLSKASVESDWVEWEVTQARNLERKEKRNVLCPVMLDNTWKECSWPGWLRHQIKKKYVLDFSQWRHPETMERQFKRLAEGLHIYYPRESGANDSAPT